MNDKTQELGQDALQDEIEVNLEISTILEDVKELSSKIKDLTKSKNEKAGILKEFMKDSKELKRDGKTLLTYNYGKDKTVFDSTRFEVKHPGLWNDFTKTETGHRTLSIKK